ncbi:DHCW motif cupin fold protein [Vibrio kasasachensis]|uniref:DHCW motif cupin fold protein n=1 Tax=Vibrio kasasachensis TaxID=2910248 RepID=UPI003D129CA1
MDIDNLPFGITDWSEIEATEHTGETGVAYWRTKQFGKIRVRMMEYSPNYLADHWCDKGHVLFCISGELTTELEDGRTYVLKPGMSYQVADNAEAHRSSTEFGAKLFVVD